MCATVIPVIRKLFEDEEQRPCPPLVHRHCRESIIPRQSAEQRDDDRMINGARDAVPDRDDQRQPAFAPWICFALCALVENRLDSNRQRKYWQNPQRGCRSVK